MNFYMVLSGSSLDKKLDFYPYLMMPASYFFSKRTMDFTLSKFIPPHKSFFLDSGGFSLLSKWHEYPFNMDQYSSLIRRIKPTFAATMDYPCEPILEITNKESMCQLSVKDRIIKTIENNELMLNNYSYNGTKIIPVIQGWDLGDYKFCIDEMHKRELITDYVAFGSMCQRNRYSKLFTKIMDHIRRYSDAKTHFFGFKISFLRNYAIFSRLHSCDTAAWTHNDCKYKYQKKQMYASNQSELKRNWYSYLDKVNNIFQKHKYQTTLFDFHKIKNYI